VTTVREAEAGDLPALELLETASMGLDAWSGPALAAELAAVPATRHAVVAEHGGAVVGYGIVRVVADSADVQRVAVDPAHRGRGTGRRLLHALLAEADRRGCVEVLLEVAADNGAGQALYASAGFVQIARRPGYYPGGRDAVVMRARRIWLG